MTQRIKPTSNILNLDQYSERHSSKKERYPSPSKPKASSGKLKEKTTLKQPLSMPVTNQMTKAKPNVKQKNIPSPISSISENVVQYSASEDSALVEVTVKTNGNFPNTRRSKDFLGNREPWGQLLKQQKSKDNVSLFGNFDPLRTLHFLVKELQIQLRTLVPGEHGIQQMVSDMQFALKRVPPEVASTIHLQQAIELLPSHKKFHRSQSVGYDRPDSRMRSINLITLDKSVQTLPTTEQEEIVKLQTLMEKSTSKLEITCQQFENLCTQLKKEKKHIEEQLQLERETTDMLKQRITELELENNDLINNTIKRLEIQKKALEEEVEKQRAKTEEYKAYKAEIKVILEDLKCSKTTMEDELMKLKHQLRINAIEKEKYVAILAVRDRQINEIRAEMTQLQEVVNGQLIELHNNAAARIPSNFAVTENNQEKNKSPIGDGTISSIQTAAAADDPAENKQGNSFQELQSGDSDVLSILQSLPDNGFVDRMNRFFSKTAEQKHSEETSIDLKKPLVGDNFRNILNDIEKM